MDVIALGRHERHLGLLVVEQRQVERSGIQLAAEGVHRSVFERLRHLDLRLRSCRAGQIDLVDLDDARRRNDRDGLGIQVHRDAVLVVGRDLPASVRLVGSEDLRLHRRLDDLRVGTRRRNNDVVLVAVDHREVDRSLFERSGPDEQTRIRLRSNDLLGRLEARTGQVEFVGLELLGPVGLHPHVDHRLVGNDQRRTVERYRDGEAHVAVGARERPEVVDQHILQVGVRVLAPEIAGILVFGDGLALAAVNLDLVIVGYDIVVAVFGRRGPLHGQGRLVGCILVQDDRLGRRVDLHDEIVPRIGIVHLLVAGRKSQCAQKECRFMNCFHDFHDSCF